MKFNKNNDLNDSLDLTEILMKPYYQKYNLNWNREERRDLLETAEHYRIHISDEFAGFFAFKTENCATYIIDMQIRTEFQNRGIGSHIFEFIEKKARNAGSEALKLSVFKENPAVILYHQKGFSIQQELNIVYRMAKAFTPGESNQCP